MGKPSARKQGGDSAVKLLGELLARNDLPCGHRAPRLLHIGGGPSEIVFGHRLKVRDGNSGALFNRGEGAGRDLLFKPFRLFVRNCYFHSPKYNRALPVHASARL